MDTIKKVSFSKYILLGIITFGIYGLVVICKMGDNVNKVCDGDGKKQMPYILAWLLGFVTFGILPLIWVYKAMDRLQDNAYRYNITVQYGGSDYLLWNLLGMFIFVGPIIAIYHYIQDINQFVEPYNQLNPASYSQDYSERIAAKPTPKQIATRDVNNVHKELPPIKANNNVIDYAGPTDRYGKNNYARGKISILSGPYSGADIPIQNQETIKIGKDPSKSNIVIENDYVSACHCSIQYDAENNRYIVTDFSTNGTYFRNGARFERNKPTYIDLGTEICVFDSSNVFRLN